MFSKKTTSFLSTLYLVKKRNWAQGATKKNVWFFFIPNYSIILHNFFHNSFFFFYYCFSGILFHLKFNKVICHMLYINVWYHGIVLRISLNHMNIEHNKFSTFQNLIIKYKKSSIIINPSFSLKIRRQFFTTINNNK